ncbi:MAG TPA: hypothetical protein VEB66_16285 [Opitutaceae bacterium]|nr:hypothetical protein [Opitutaceae bacterium]
MSSGPSSTGPEYYIRGLNDAEARGPFAVEQLASLAESGQITQTDTYFYDATTEQWMLLSQSAELKATLWPEKKKLGFKEKEFKAINQEVSGSAAPITVQQFLDAAEGKTEDTKGKKDKSESMMSAAAWGTRAAAVACLASAVALALPSVEAITAMDWPKILERPIILLGIIDLVLGVLLLLGLIQLYPFVRFRAVFGLGFLGFLFWLNGQSTALVAVAAGCAGLYFCTIFLSYIPLAIAAVAAVGGMLMLATQPL